MCVSFAVASTLLYSRLLTVNASASDEMLTIPRGILIIPGGMFTIPCCKAPGTGLVNSIPLFFRKCAMFVVKDDIC